MFFEQVNLKAIDEAGQAFGKSTNKQSVTVKSSRTGCANEPSALLRLRVQRL